MGRTVIAEETVKTSLTSATASQKLQIGLLIGKVTESKDLIGLSVHTPPLQDFNTAADKDNEDSDTFVDWWVVEHASQIYGMLPGGLNVVGVFVCCPSQLLAAIQARLSKLLTDIAACQEFKGLQPHEHQILLHYCCTKKKFKCQTINLADMQAGFRPAEFKLKSHLSQWCQIESVVRLDTECYIPCSSAASGSQGQQKKDANLSHAQARAGVDVVLESVQGGVVTLRGHLAKQDGNSLIKQAKKHQSTEVIQATLYLKRAQKELAPPTRIPDARRISLKGNMSIIAYVPPKATYAEAIAAVKQDVCRSLVSRIQAMVEGCSQSGTVLDQLPVRVTLSTPVWHFNFTEYTLPHEDTKECIHRASDLLGPSVDVITAQSLEQFRKEGDTDTSTLAAYEGGGFKGYFGFISIFASISAVLISISLWIMLQ